MKNLFERLKPEIREAIENDLALYPSSMTELIEELSNNYFISDVRYGCIIHIQSHFIRIFKKSFINAWECFIEE